MRSHEKLDVTESRVAIDDVDALQLDLQLTFHGCQRVGSPGRVDLLLVVTRFDIVHGCPSDVFVINVVTLVDLRRLQKMTATAPWLLRESTVALETLDADGQQKLVPVHQRRGQLWI